MKKYMALITDWRLKKKRLAIETTQIKHREPLLLLFLNDKVIVSYGATSRGLTYV